MGWFIERTQRLERRWSDGLAAFLLSLACGLVLAVPAGAAMKAPEVGYLAASHVTTTSATIEVPINPEGGETSYEIWLECQSAKDDKQGCEPLTVGPQRQQGVLPPSTEPQIVTDAVTGLQPGYLYSYGVTAINSAGKEGYVGDGFLTCPPAGSCPSQPYLAGEALWNIEGAARAAAESASTRSRTSGQTKGSRRTAGKGSGGTCRQRTRHLRSRRARRPRGSRTGCTRPLAVMCRAAPEGRLASPGPPSAP